MQKETEKKIQIGEAQGASAPSGQKLTLEDFELIEKLGKGSFGAVFLVRKKGDPSKTYYAMKVLEKDKVF